SVICHIVIAYAALLYSFWSCSICLAMVVSLVVSIYSWHCPGFCSPGCFSEKPQTVMAVSISLITLAVSSAVQHRQLWAEARASLLYFENFELINSQLAYGAAGPETSPFQHIWSLSVQGQFYLL